MALVGGVGWIDHAAHQWSVRRFGNASGENDGPEVAVEPDVRLLEMNLASARRRRPTPAPRRRRASQRRPWLMALGALHRARIKTPLVSQSSS